MLRDAPWDFVEFKLKNPSVPNEEIARQCGVSQLIVRQALTRFSIQLGNSLGGDDNG
jgi:hypothetical protein